MADAYMDGCDNVNSNITGKAKIKRLHVGLKCGGSWP